jgi:hypothetical protein
MTVFAYAEIAMEWWKPPIPQGTAGEVLHTFGPNPEGPNVLIVRFGTRNVVCRADCLAYEMPLEASA